MSGLTKTLYDEACAEAAGHVREWRREGHRRLIHEELDIRLQTAGSRMLPACTLDVTPTSIGILCRQPLSAHSPVKVCRALGTPEEDCHGVVVYCTQSLSGFRIGITVQNAAPS